MADQRTTLTSPLPSLQSLRHHRTLWQRRHELLPIEHSLIEKLVSQWNSSARLQQVQPLTGGACNTNLRLVFENHPPLVLRFYVREPTYLHKDRALVPLWKQAKLPVPALLAWWDEPELPAPCALWEWVEGEPLEEVLTKVSAEEVRVLGREVGSLLASLYAVEMPNAGILGPELSLDPAFDSFPVALVEFALQCLEGRARQRLSTTLYSAVKAGLLTHRTLLEQSEPKITLVHSDFNGTNMLASKDDEGWKISALLDWEFATAGTTLFDLGQMLRYERLFPSEYVQSLTNAFVEGGGRLPENWRRICAWMDVVNLCGFLNDVEERPAFFSHVRELLQHTVEEWGADTL